MDTGFLILLQIIGLYLTFGPLVLLLLYALFDALGEYKPTPPAQKTAPLKADELLKRKHADKTLTALVRQGLSSLRK